MKKWLAILFVALWAACMFAGCGSSRQIEKAQRALDRHTDAAAHYCATKFPVVESVKFLPGDTITNTVTETKTEFVDVDCPPSEKGTVVKTEIKYKDKVVTKVIHDTVLVTKENTAKTRALEGDLRATNAELQEHKKEAEKWKEKAQKRGKEIWVYRLILLGIAAWVTKSWWLPAGARLLTLISKLLGK